MKKAIITTALSAIAVAGLAPAAFAQAAAPTAPATNAPATAAAGAAANPTVGAKVFDAQGAEVGTVEAVAGDNVTVSTGTARAGLPKSAFVSREKGLTIGMTKVQLEAAVNGAQAQTTAAKDTAIVADAPVKSSDGVVLGTITKVEGDAVTLTLSNGSAAGLTKQNIGLAADGSLAIGMTAADFNKAAQAAGSAQASAGAAAAPSITTPEAGPTNQ